MTTAKRHPFEKLLTQLPRLRELSGEELGLVAGGDAGGIGSDQGNDAQNYQDAGIPGDYSMYTGPNSVATWDNNGGVADAWSWGSAQDPTSSTDGGDGDF